MVQTTSPPLDLDQGKTQSIPLSSDPSTARDGPPSSHSPQHPSNRLMNTISNSQSLSRFRSSRQSHARSRTRARSEDSMSEDPELPRQPRAESPPAPEANAPPHKEEVTALRLTAHYAGLVLSSMLGCLIRLGLSALGTYDGSIIFALAWSQGVGSGIMGLSLARKNEIISIYPPIYTFLTTGIAGSVTTFSSWMLGGYLAFSNFDDYNRKGLHDTVDGVAYSLSTFAIALASLRFGEHFAGFLPSLTIFQRKSNHRRNSAPDRLPSIINGNGNGNSNSSSLSSDQTQIQPHQNSSCSDPEKSKTHIQSHSNRLSQTPIIDLIWILTAFISYLIILLIYFLGPRRWRHDVIFPLLLSPPGAMFRFYLSKFNTNPKFIDKFPIGTFIANITATIIISICFAEQRRPTSHENKIRCNGLNSIQQGFCGCLSTVSTFVVESRTIKNWKFKWSYIGSSVVLGHLLVLVIVGGIGWSKGYGEVCKG